MLILIELIRTQALPLPLPNQFNLGDISDQSYLERFATNLVRESVDVIPEKNYETGEADVLKTKVKSCLQMKAVILTFVRML